MHDRVYGSAPVRRVVRGGGAAFAVHVAAAGTTYCSQLLIARMVGVDSFGVYAYVTATMVVLAYIAALGFDVGDQFRLLTLNSVPAAPTPLDLAAEGSAWAFEAWLACAFTLPGTFLCDRSASSIVRLSGLTFTLEDEQAPRVQLGGAAGAAG